MKLLTAAAVLLLFLGSCKKDNSTANSTGATLQATWQLRSVTGQIVISYKPGDSILKFTAANYIMYSKGQMVRSGTYAVVDDTSFNALVVPKGQFTHRIIFDGDTTSFKKFFQITGKTLTVLSGFFASDSGSEMDYEQITEM